MAHRKFHREEERAAPEQLYTDPADAPSGLQCAFSTAEEARAGRRYWHMRCEPVFAAAPEKSLFVYPAAVRLEGDGGLLDRVTADALARGDGCAGRWEVPRAGPHAVPPGERPAASAVILEPHARYIKESRAHAPYAAARRILRGDDEAAKTRLRRDSLTYMQRQIGTGVYVRIEDGQVRQFVPFTAWESDNDWGATLVAEKMDPAFRGDAASFRRTVAKFTRKSPADLEADPAKWTVSGSVIGMEDWTGSTVNSKIPELRWLLDATLSRYRVRNCEFIFNRRDSPALHKDARSPHFHLFDQEGASGPLPDDVRALIADACLPVLSQSSIPAYFADVMIPTQDDVLLATGKSFINKAPAPMLAPDSDPECVTAWKKKRATAVFRGTGTGAGVDAETNQRFKLALIAERAARNHQLNEGNAVDGVPFFDAGVVSFNVRPRKSHGLPLTIANVRRLGIATKPPMDFCEQSRYKYSIYVDGHAFAFRLLRVMLSNSLVLRVESAFGYSGWYAEMLEPWKHFVPVKSDLSDLIAQVEWCKRNDAEARKIAEQGRQLAEKIYGEEYLCAYMAAALSSLG